MVSAPLCGIYILSVLLNRLSQCPPTAFAIDAAMFSLPLICGGIVFFASVFVLLACLGGVFSDGEAQPTWALDNFRSSACAGSLLGLSVAAMLWPEDFAKLEEFVKNDSIAFVKGTLDRRRDPAELTITRIIPLDRAPAELSKGVVVTLRKGEIDERKDLESLLRKLRVRPGNLDVFLEILGISGVKRAIYRVGPSLKIRYDDQLIADFEGTVKLGNVRLVGNRGATARVDLVERAVVSDSGMESNEFSDASTDSLDDD